MPGRRGGPSAAPGPGPASAPAVGVGVGGRDRRRRGDGRRGRRGGRRRDRARCEVADAETAADRWRAGGVPLPDRAPPATTRCPATPRSRRPPRSRPPTVAPDLCRSTRRHPDRARRSRIPERGEPRRTQAAGYRRSGEEVREPPASRRSTSPGVRWWPTRVIHRSGNPTVADEEPTSWPTDPATDHQRSEGDPDGKPRRLRPPSRRPPSRRPRSRRRPSRRRRSRRQPPSPRRRARSPRQARATAPPRSTSARPPKAVMAPPEVIAAAAADDGVLRADRIEINQGAPSNVEARSLSVTQGGVQRRERRPGRRSTGRHRAGRGDRRRRQPGRDRARPRRARLARARRARDGRGQRGAREPGLRPQRPRPRPAVRAGPGRDGDRADRDVRTDERRSWSCSPRTSTANVTTLLDWRGALAFGAVAGAADRAAPPPLTAARDPRTTDPRLEPARLADRQRLATIRGSSPAALAAAALAALAAPRCARGGSRRRRPVRPP